MVPRLLTINPLEKLAGELTRSGRLRHFTMTYPQQVQRWVMEGVVPPGNLAWREGLADWVPVSELLPKKAREQIKDKIKAGLFIIDVHDFKNIIKPSPKRCLKLLEEILPKLFSNQEQKGLEF